MKILSQEPFNTNNAWGFGGGIGVEYIFSDGWRIRKGTAHFRHLPPERFVRAIPPAGVEWTKEAAEAHLEALLARKRKGDE